MIKTKKFKNKIIVKNLVKVPRLFLLIISFKPPILEDIGIEDINSARIPFSVGETISI